jgi:signal transduction histidine kinase/ActR/RegA family two-component response regulator
MNREHADIESAPSGEDVLGSLRNRVLRGALNLLAVAVPCLAVFVVFSELRGGTLNNITIGLGTYTLVFPLLRLASPRLGFRGSALALIGLLAFTAFLVELRGGVAVGNISLNVIALTLSALFFGRRGAAFGLLTVLALFGLAAFMVVDAHVPPIVLAMWDPTSPNFWLRQFVSLALFGLAIAVTEVYIVEQLAREARRLQLQAEREHLQRLALERSERDREHEREQRLEALRALEESRRIEALARLAGGIAHDFNNGLTVILGTAELLKKGSSSPAEVEAYADEIVEAAARTGELTHQLLTLGRRQVSKPQRVQVSSLLARVSATFRRVLPSDVSLLVETPDESVFVHIDPTEFERSLFNLVINARDAMPRGGKLTIGCRVEAVTEGMHGLAAGRYVGVSVSDTGEGMDQETLARIFDPFFTTKAPGMGTGLGLATVYAFASASGGAVHVESKRGVGTTFLLWLPEGTSAAEPIAPAAQSSVGNATTPANARVLVVEDNVEVRTSMVRILAHAGFEVSEAADGDAAMAVLGERNDFGLMCIDGVMPGVATATVIERAGELAPSMHILLCSGYLQEDLLRRGVAAGRYAFLQKPFSTAGLLTSVRGLLASQGAAVE